MCGLLQISTATMIHLLIYRLKFAVPPDAANSQCVKFSADAANLFYYCTAIFCTCAFGLMDEDQLVAKNRILKKFLVPHPNLWDTRFVSTDRENPNFVYYLYITIAEITILVINIIAIPTISFHYLSANRTEKSDRLARAHKQTLQVLVFQLAIHCIFHLLPLICFTCSTIFRTKNIFMLSIGMYIWALHGSACTLALILANKPFRITVKEHLKYGRSLLT
ncbi:hypothetical protein B9Z55_014078 [Caenorhabditis nigoni]|uniref:7TM GPCR serpentine receptor class x (Srx) domain-containing protein n=1 Tax=Caenorhabditis nigoni TaxID=1611254 RepID=A0A2G5U4F3_9PELO|nr:hypothetical protein B9Z55_014078 [Caenorhabditis nigoni]